MKVSGPQRSNSIFTYIRECIKQWADLQYVCLLVLNGVRNCIYRCRNKVWQNVQAHHKAVAEAQFLSHNKDLPGIINTKLFVSPLAGDATFILLSHFLQGL